MEVSASIYDFLPELILLVGACIVLVVGIGRKGQGLAGALALGVTLLALVAAWRVPPDVTRSFPGLLLTPLVHYVRMGGLIVGALILLCNLHLPIARERGEFFAMILFSLAGLLLTASANDLVVLFLAIELVSVPTYVLVSLSREDIRASEAGVKYFFLGALAAAIMVYGFSFLYGSLGGHMTLMATAGQEGMSSFVDGSSELSVYAFIGLLLALGGLFFKLAAVPFHVYAPDVYEGAASPVTGLLGFLPKFAGFVAAAKLLAVFNWFQGVGGDGGTAVLWMLWVVAALTMTVGNAVALLQNNVKRILAYSSIAHSGYMLVALLVGPVAGQGPMHDGVAAMLFYIVVYGMMNLGAFCVLAALARDGKPVENLRDLAGLSTRHPSLALAMAVCCFSLMGFPPTAGMLGKVYIFSSAFSVGDGHPFGGPLVWLAVIGVINSAIGAAYYLRIIAACYIKPATAKTTERVGGPALGLGIALCSLAMIVVFIRPLNLVRGAQQASAELTSSPTAVNIASATQP